MPDKPIDTLLPTIPTVPELAALLEDARIRQGLAGVLDQADELEAEEFDELEVSRVPRKRGPRGR